MVFNSSFEYQSINDLISSCYRYIVDYITPSQQDAVSIQQPNVTHENSSAIIEKEEQEKAANKVCSEETTTASDIQKQL